MKKYLFFLFGILDVLTIAYHYDYWMRQFAAPSINWASALILVFHLSLLFSAYLYFRRQRFAFLLYYLQIPVRFFLLSFSFSFILSLGNLFDDNALIAQILFWTCVTLELGRIIVSVKMHQVLRNG